jgi:hypothetical protein
MAKQRISFENFHKAVGRAQQAHPEWRYGQTLFNVLQEYEPDLARGVLAEELDPFYVDRRAGAFLDWLETQLP